MPADCNVAWCLQFRSRCTNILNIVVQGMEKYFRRIRCWKPIFNILRITHAFRQNNINLRLSKKRKDNISNWQKQIPIHILDVLLTPNHSVQLYCCRSIQKYIKKLTEGIYRVVPAQFLSVFEPHEIEMLLNGPQVIDIKDWK
jgi:hypothetical protein